MPSADSLWQKPEGETKEAGSDDHVCGMSVSSYSFQIRHATGVDLMSVCLVWITGSHT